MHRIKGTEAEIRKTIVYIAQRLFNTCKATSDVHTLVERLESLKLPCLQTVDTRLFTYYWKGRPTSTVWLDLMKIAKETVIKLAIATSNFDNPADILLLKETRNWNTIPKSLIRYQAAAKAHQVSQGLSANP